MDIITYGLLNKRIKKKADINSPHFTGEPTAPTPEYPDDSERIATTEFVNDAIEAAGPHTVYTLDREGKMIVLSGSDGTYSRAELPYMFMSTEEWDQQPPMVSEPGYMYIWSDRYESPNGYYIPGVKIGDGNAYVADLPFQDEAYFEHIFNTEIHITQEEREFWNNKVTCYIETENPNNLIFTKDNVIIFEEGGNN